MPWVVQCVNHSCFAVSLLLQMCAAAPFEHEHSVVFDIPTYVVDLDLPANQRYVWP